MFNFLFTSIYLFAISASLFAQQVPLGFEKNIGQYAPQVRFAAHSTGQTIFLLPGGELGIAARAGASPLRMRLTGGNPDSQAVGLDLLPGKTNHYLGANTKQWFQQIPNYRRVQWKNVYPGIDLVYYGAGQRAEYDFVVAAGADPNQIQMSFEGGSAPRLTSGGEIEVDTAGGKLRLHKPRVFQVVDGEKIEVASAYRLQGNAATFALAKHRADAELVIDPVVEFATYLGGNGQEANPRVAVDSGGATYVAGSTSSTDFPVANPFPGVFVTKVNAEGSGLAYATYISGAQGVSAIKVNAGGEAYVLLDVVITPFAGNTGRFAPVRRVALAKLNAAGSLEWSTGFGEPSADGSGVGLALDSSSKPYVLIQPSANRYPTSPGAFKPQPAATDSHVFVIKLSADGTTREYATYLGSSGLQRSEEAEGISVDSLGSAIITGRATNFGGGGGTVGPAPTTFGAHRTQYSNAVGGAIDGWLVKLGATGTGLHWATLLVGRNNVFPTAVAVDASDRIYVAGSTDLPTRLEDIGLTNGEPLSPAGSGIGGSFLVTFSTSGALASRHLQGATSFSRTPRRTQLAVTPEGTAWVAATVDGGVSHNWPLVGPTDALLGPGGASEVWLYRLAAPGIVDFATFFGGSSSEDTWGMATDGSGAAYLVGNTFSTDLALVGALDSTYRNQEVYLAKFGNGRTTMNFSSSPSGRSFSIAGAGCAAGSYTTPASVVWSNGSSCSVSITTPQPNGVTGQFVFTGWADGSTATSRVFTTASTIPTMNFTEESLTKQLQLSGDFQISTSPTGTACGPGCFRFPINTVVNLQGAALTYAGAIPVWNGCVLGGSPNTCRVTMDADKTVSASFNRVMLRNIPYVPASFTNSPEPLPKTAAENALCPASVCVVYPQGALVTLTSPTSQVVWEGCNVDAGDAAVCRYNAVADAVVTARSWPQIQLGGDFEITSATSGGAFCGTPVSTNCLTFRPGGSVLLQAQPSAAYPGAVPAWSGCTPEPANAMQCRLTLTANINVSANFERVMLRNIPFESASFTNVPAPLVKNSAELAACSAGVCVVYPRGADVTLTSPTELVSWAGCNVDSANPAICRYRAVADAVVSALPWRRLNLSGDFAVVATSQGGKYCGAVGVVTPECLTFPRFAQVTLRAVAPTNYQGAVPVWNGCATDPTNLSHCTLTVDGDANISARFDRVQLRLVSLGQASFTATPAALPLESSEASCTGTCSVYPRGARIALSAAQPPDNRPVSWTGCTVSPSNPLFCSLTAEPNAIASIRETFKLQLAGDVVAAVTPAGSSCGENCSFHVTGALVTVTASGAPAGVAPVFTGCAASPTNPNACGFNLTADTVVRVSLPARQRLTVTSVLPAGFTAAPAPAASCGVGCTEYVRGTVVTLTANARPGGEAVLWTGCAVVAGNPDACTVTVDGDKTVSVGYAAPRIDAVSPTPVAFDTETLVTLQGANFNPGITVTLDGAFLASSAVEIVSKTQLRVRIRGARDAAGYSATLVVINVDRQTATTPIIISPAVTHALRIVSDAPYVVSEGASCGADCFNVTQGRLVTITATVLPGEGPLVWSGCASNVSTPTQCSVTMDAAKNVTITLPKQRLTVTTTLPYTVSEGVSCGANCWTVVKGRTVTLVTTEAPVEWTGCNVSGIDLRRCSVLLDGDKTVTLGRLAQFRVTLDADVPLITVGDSAGSCGANCFLVNRDGRFALRVAPAAGNPIVRWMGCTFSESDNTCRLTVTADAVISAKRRVRLVIAGEANGEYYSPPVFPERCPGGQTCYLVSPGVTVDIPARGFPFVSVWTGCQEQILTPNPVPGGDPIARGCRVTPVADTTVQVAHERISLTVLKSGSGEGSVTRLDGQICEGQCITNLRRDLAGPLVSLRASAAPGSIFVGWRYRSGPLNPSPQAVNAYDLNVPFAQTETVTAVFDRATPANSIRVQVDGGYQVQGFQVGPEIGWGSSCGPNCFLIPKAYPAGFVRFNTNRNTGFLMEWTACPNASMVGTGQCIFGLENDVTLRQAKVFYALQVQRNGNGAVTSEGINCGTQCSGSYDVPGSIWRVVTLTAAPSAGNVFTGWGGDCSGQAATCSVTMDRARNVQANFAVAATANVVFSSITAQRISGTAADGTYEITLTARNVGTAPTELQTPVGPPTVRVLTGTATYSNVYAGVPATAGNLGGVKVTVRGAAGARLTVSTPVRWSANLSVTSSPVQTSAISGTVILP